MIKQCHRCHIKKSKFEYSKTQWKKKSNAKCMECLPLKPNKQQCKMNGNGNKKIERYFTGIQMKTKGLDKGQFGAIVTDNIVKLFKYPKQSSLTSSVVDIISSYIYLNFGGVYSCDAINDLFERDCHSIALYDDYAFEWKHICFSQRSQDITTEDWNRSGSFVVSSPPQQSKEGEYMKLILSVKNEWIKSDFNAFLRIRKYGDHGTLEVMDRINPQKTLAKLTKVQDKEK
eukprot:461717_1